MIYAILLLGGSSKRLNISTPKQFLKFNNRDLFTYSYETLARNEKIDKIILVTGKNYLEHVYDIISNFKVHKPFEIVIGGESRQESVFNALNYLKDKLSNEDKVLIHDSSRPLITSKIINNIIEASKEYGNVSTYVSTYDSIASINGDYIEKYLNRDEIISIQTPQIFNFTDIYNAHIKARKENKIYTDDASLLVNDEKKIKLIKGDRFNFKITTFDDLMILKSILEEE